MLARRDHLDHPGAVEATGIEGAEVLRTGEDVHDGSGRAGRISIDSMQLMPQRTIDPFDQFSPPSASSRGRRQPPSVVFARSGCRTGQRGLDEGGIGTWERRRPQRSSAAGRSPVSTCRSSRRVAMSISVAVCDLSPAIADYTAARYGAGSAYTDHTEMLAVVRPQVVHVLTPPLSHARLVTEALEAGCHVLCEKPITPDTASLRELLDVGGGQRSDPDGDAEPALQRPAHRHRPPDPRRPPRHGRERRRAAVDRHRPRQVRRSQRPERRGRPRRRCHPRLPAAHGLPRAPLLRLSRSGRRPRVVAQRQWGVHRSSSTRWKR